MTRSPRLSFHVIPAVDVLGGQAVQLRAGNPEAPVWRGGPAAAAVSELATAGASFIHVIDLDGALHTRPTRSLIRELTASAKDARLQVGGGLRSIAAIGHALDQGAARAVVGTAMVSSSFARDAALEYGQRLVAAIDADGDSVAIRGWRGRRELRATELAKRLADAGVCRLSLTSVKRDGSLQGPDLALVESVVSSVDLPVLAAGGIRSVEDLRRLEEIGCEGAIVGSAIWTGRLPLDEILAARPEPSRDA